MTGATETVARRLPPQVWYLAGPLAFLALFLVLPFVLLVAVSLTHQFPVDATPSVGNYHELFRKPLYLQYLGTTLLFGAVVTALCLVTAYPLAYFMVRHARRSYHFLLLGVISPLLIGVVVRTIGWTILLGVEGLLNDLLVALRLVPSPVRLLYTPAAATLGLVHVLLPFMVLSIVSVLSLIDRSLEEAAHSLGADELRVFWRVTLPLSLRGVAVGCVIVFSLSIGAYLTPVLLGGGKMRLLAPLIYEEIASLVNWSFGSAMAVVLLVAGLGLLLVAPALVRLGHRRHG